MGLTGAWVWICSAAWASLVSIIHTRTKRQICMLMAVQLWVGGYSLITEIYLVFIAVIFNFSSGHIFSQVSENAQLLLYFALNFPFFSPWLPSLLLSVLFSFLLYVCLQVAFIAKSRSAFLPFPHPLSFPALLLHPLSHCSFPYARNCSFINRFHYVSMDFLIFPVFKHHIIDFIATERNESPGHSTEQVSLSQGWRAGG